MSNERTPLISSSKPGEVHVDEADADEQPQAYIYSNSGGAPSIKCRVCQNLLNLEGKMDCHVTKCSRCNEATPIKAAPFGKKYVRCKCKCLLICKAGSHRVACPRASCKLIVVLDSSRTRVLSPGVVRVQCVHCQQYFLFSMEGKNLSRCPHCKKISSVCRKFELRKVIIFSAIGLLFLAIACIVLGFTFKLVHQKPGLIALYIALFLLSLPFFGRALYLRCLKVSQVDATPPLHV